MFGEVYPNTHRTPALTTAGVLRVRPTPMTPREQAACDQLAAELRDLGLEAHKIARLRPHGLVVLHMAKERLLRELMGAPHP